MLLFAPELRSTGHCNIGDKLDFMNEKGKAPRPFALADLARQPSLDDIWAVGAQFDPSSGRGEVHPQGRQLHVGHIQTPTTRWVNHCWPRIWRASSEPRDHYMGLLGPASTCA